ncbi:CaiB/BaiF CoA transferase family protein [Chloroflexota bacterium]
MELALEGIRVMQTAAALAAPMAGRILADWGADVIWIEHPVRGDIVRASNAAGRRGGRVILADVDYILQNHNRNKRGMTLDLSQERGREIIYRLLRKADVFLSNFRQRELEKFKLEYEALSQLNPRLIYANVSGYGRKGPDKDLPGFEHTSYFSRSGLLHILQSPGTPPPQIPLGSGDYVASLAIACGITTALYMRERTGIGQEVDVSLFHAGVYTASVDVGGSLLTGQDRQSADRKDVTNAATNFYQTKDGRWIRLGLNQPDLYWTKLCRAIERKDLEHDPRFDSFQAKMENHVTLFRILEEVFLSRTLDEWRVRLNEAGLPWSPVQSLPEVAADPQARANDFFVSFDVPSHGHIESVANPIKLSKSPENVRMPAPAFNQHTEEILLEYGYTWEDITQFKEQGIIA